jgi:hypothetical protein
LAPDRDRDCPGCGARQQHVLHVPSDPDVVRARGNDRADTEEVLGNRASLSKERESRALPGTGVPSTYRPNSSSHPETRRMLDLLSNIPFSLSTFGQPRRERSMLIVTITDLSLTVVLSKFAA